MDVDDKRSAVAWANTWLAEKVSPGSNARRFAHAADELRGIASHYKYRGRPAQADDATEAAEALDALATECAAREIVLAAERAERLRQADAAQEVRFAELRAKYPG